MSRSHRWLQRCVALTLCVALGSCTTTATIPSSELLRAVARPPDQTVRLTTSAGKREFTGNSAVRFRVTSAEAGGPPGKLYGLTLRLGDLRLAGSETFLVPPYRPEQDAVPAAALRDIESTVSDDEANWLILRASLAVGLLVGLVFGTAELLAASHVRCAAG